MTAAKIVKSIKAGQEIPVALADGNWRDRERQVADVDPRAGACLLLVNALHADIAVQVTEGELDPRLQRGHVLFDPPRFVIMVGVIHRDRNEIVIAVECGRDIDCEDIAEAGKAEVSRANEQLGVDQSLHAVVLEEQVPLVDALLLVAPSEVHADIDRLDVAAGRLVPQALIEGIYLFLDMGNLVQTVVSPTAPGCPVAERHLAGVSIVEPFRILREPITVDVVANIPADCIENAIVVLSGRSHAAAEAEIVLVRDLDALVS